MHNPEDEELTTISMSAISPRPQEDTEVFQSSVGNLSIRIIGVSCSLPLERASSGESSSKVRCFVQPGQNSIKNEKEEERKESIDSQKNDCGEEQAKSACGNPNDIQSCGTQEKNEKKNQEPFMSIFEPGKINYQALLETGVRDVAVVHL